MAENEEHHHEHDEEAEHEQHHVGPGDADAYEVPPWVDQEREERPKDEPGRGDNLPAPEPGPWTGD